MFCSILKAVCFSRVIPESCNSVIRSHMCSTSRKKHCALGLRVAQSQEGYVFLCVQSTFICSKRLKSLAWVCYSPFLITSPFEEQMNVFPSSPPTPLPHLFFPPRAESSCLGGKTWQWRCTNPWELFCQKAAVYFPCVFFACVMNRVLLQNSSPGDPSSVSYYTQGHWEGASLS